MTDGPFKNSELPRLWKRFGEAVLNQAVDDDERCARAARAVLGDLSTEDTESLVSKLQDITEQQQLDLDTASVVESIFDNHAKTPFADLLQKELIFRLRQNVSPKEALSQAIEECVRGHISDAKNRFHEECIHRVETTDMAQSDCDSAVYRANKILDSLVGKEICDAVAAGNKNAFKKEAAKKAGLDEGPDL